MTNHLTDMVFDDNFYLDLDKTYNKCDFVRTYREITFPKFYLKKFIFIDKSCKILYMSTFT